MDEVLQIRQRPSGPAFSAVERVSPTLAESLRECPLKVAFGRDPAFRFLKKATPASALGIAVHELIDRAQRGQFAAESEPARRAAVDGAWEELIARSYEELRSQWRLGEVPEPDTWPGFALTRVVATRWVMNWTPRVAGGSSATRVVAEEPLAPKGLAIVGRPDRVEIAGSRIEIVDIKSGWSQPTEMSPRHRRQLLAYCFIWHACHGSWPTVASIQRLDGKRLSMEVMPHDAEAAGVDMASLLEDYNLRVASGHNTDAFAKPSEEACRWCDYSLACDGFFRVVTHEWSWYRKCALGDVVDIASSRQGLRVTLKRIAGDSLHDDGWVAVQVPVQELEAPRPGSRLAFVRLLPTRSADLKTSWDSQACEWGERPEEVQAQDELERGDSRG